jgi:hypothetical protein
MLSQLAKTLAQKMAFGIYRSWNPEDLIFEVGNSCKILFVAKVLV